MNDPSALIAQGVHARGQRNLPAARNFYEQAALTYFERGERLSYAHTLRHIADMYLEEGNFAHARPRYEEAIENYRGNLNTKVLDLANAIRPYALLLEHLRETESARSLWQEARTLYGAVRVDAGVKECDQHIAQL